MERFREKMGGAILHSFRNTQQFLEAEFSNDMFEEIIFFIDCKMSCSHDEISNIAKKLNEIDPDVSDIIYFILANNKKVLDVDYTPDTLKIIFSNGYYICFYLNSEYEYQLSISFRIEKNEGNYESVNL